MSTAAKLVIRKIWLTGKQDVYAELEAKVKELIASGTLDEKRQIAYQSFLFIIM